MSPSSRLVAFFIGNDGEVVADSTLLEIDDGLPNKASYAPSFFNSAFNINLFFNFIEFKKYRSRRIMQISA